MNYMEDKKLKFGVDLIQIPVLIEVEKPTLERIGREAFMELLFKAVTEMKVDGTKVVWGLIEVDGEKSSIVIEEGSLRFHKPFDGG